jgi:MFS family permease
MLGMLHILHKRLQIGKVIRSLTLHDVTYWGSFDMLMVVLALFVVTKIEGGSASDVGIALFIYKAVSLLISIPLGGLFDRIPTFKDEQIGLIASSLITGFMYLLLAFATVKWQLFLIMAIVGLSRSINLNSWRKIFNKSLNSDHSGVQLGVYDTVFSLGTALMNVIAGFMSEIYGIKVVLLVMGFIVLFGSIFPLWIYKDVAKIKN